jgi:hypothetical protein
VNTWEYKLREFVGSTDAFHALLTSEKNNAWELGALLPGQSKRQATDTSDPATPASICIIFKRQISMLATPPIAF